MLYVYATILPKRLVLILSLLDASNVAALKHSSTAQKWSVRNMAAVIMSVVGGVALVTGIVVAIYR